MAINKNFVVKNGFEVNTNLIVADAANDRVGIGTTITKHQLHIIGGIGATHSFVTGVSTIGNELRVGTNGQVFSVIAGSAGAGKSVGVGTAYPAYLLDVRSPVSTGQTALYVYGDLKVTGDLSTDDITLDQADLNRLFVSQAAQLNGGATLYVTGISTFNGYTDINNSVDISTNLRVTGVTTSTTYKVGAAQTINATGINITGVSTFSGITTVTGPTLFAKQLNVSGIGTIGTVKIFSGIITATSGVVTYFGDGSKLTGIVGTDGTAGVGIRTAGGTVGTGATILDFRGAGISTVTVASGIATINVTGGGGSASIGIGSTPGDAFVGIITAGNLWYNTNIGRLFIYYQDIDSAQWVDAAPFNVGIITTVGIGSLPFANGTAISPSWYFNNSSTTGVFSPTAGQQTFVSVGSSILNINRGGIRVTGVVTATSFSGDGSQLTGVSESKFVTTAAGIHTLSNVGIGTTNPTSKLTVTGNGIFTGVVTATDFNSLSDANYKENVATVDSALTKVDQLRGVKFDWKESGLPSYGVIAQELQEVLPELVHGNDPKTVNYNGIIGVLIEAIKELKAEVEELKNAK